MWTGDTDDADWRYWIQCELQLITIGPGYHLKTEYIHLDGVQQLSLNMFIYMQIIISAAAAASWAPIHISYGMIISKETSWISWLEMIYLVNQWAFQPKPKLLRTKWAGWGKLEIFSTFKREPAAAAEIPSYIRGFNPYQSRPLATLSGQWAAMEAILKFSGEKPMQNPPGQAKNFAAVGKKFCLAGEKFRMGFLTDKTP